MRMLPHTEANMPNTRCKRSNSYAILRKLLPPTQAKTTVGKHRKKKKLPQLATRSCLNEICVKIQAETHLPHEKTMRQLLEENEKHGAKTSRRSSVPNPRSPWGSPIATKDVFPVNPKWHATPRHNVVTTSGNLDCWPYHAFADRPNGLALHKKTKAVSVTVNGPWLTIPGSNPDVSRTRPPIQPRIHSSPAQQS